MSATQNDDTLVGTRGNDTLSGLRGDDMLIGGRGDDLLIGGNGSDVLTGGLDNDTFLFAASHIDNGSIDYITDFRIGEDTLVFKGNGGANLELLSYDLSYRTETSFNGNNLDNNVTTGTDITFHVRNSTTGAVQEIVLLDAWSGNLKSQWDAYFATLNFVGAPA